MTQTNLTHLLEQIENGLEMLLKREPEFTGSLTLQMNFLKGECKDVVKSIEKTRQIIDS
jgi:hypothetical protein